MAKTCCEFHKNKYIYLCKCKKLWADNLEWEEHAWNKHYGDPGGFIRIPSALYQHGDWPQMVARKLLTQKRIDIVA